MPAGLAAKYADVPCQALIIAFYDKAKLIVAKTYVKNPLGHMKKQDMDKEQKSRQCTECSYMHFYSSRSSA